jgi:uncharacterized protein YyaL (SSP411 family)
MGSTSHDYRYDLDALTELVRRTRADFHRAAMLLADLVAEQVIDQRDGYITLTDQAKELIQDYRYADRAYESASAILDTQLALGDGQPAAAEPPTAT